MAFEPNNMIRWAPFVNSDANTLFDVPLPIAPPVQLPQYWAYNAGNDTIANVEASGYFYYFANYKAGPLYANGSFIQVGDLIYCVCSNGVVQLSVTSLNPIVTTANETGFLSTSLTNGNIFVGNASNIATGVTPSGVIAISNTGVASIVPGSITSASLAPTTIQYATVTGISPLTLSSAGAQLVAAPGAGNVILPIAMNFNYIFATALYTSGGAIGVQYGNNAAAGGQACSATLSAVTFDAYASSQVFGLAPAITGASSGSINKPLYLTAASLNFATGAGTITAYISYIVVAAS
jgi:hypothetical protein